MAVLKLSIGGEGREQGVGKDLSGGVTVVGVAGALVEVRCDTACRGVVRGCGDVQESESESDVEDGRAVFARVVRVAGHEFGQVVVDGASESAAAQDGQAGGDELFPRFAGLGVDEECGGAVGVVGGEGCEDGDLFTGVSSVNRPSRSAGAGESRAWISKVASRPR
ncbi:hypothetical protein ACFXEL_38365 [Streptomyces sp. NPDC059382]|uniref:hypothetical protein n=1 Tax=Streptomyces sp. NPDC059382 TaxID=3346816 RepID=UPI00369908B3